MWGAQVVEAAHVPATTSSRQQSVPTHMREPGHVDAQLQRGSVGPESAGPASAEPASGSPESAGPASGSPESAGPASAEPASSSPESGEPESAGPESGGPESAGPESGGPESRGPPSTPGRTHIGPRHVPARSSPHGVPMGSNALVGHEGEVPVQLSATSKTHSTTRHISPAEAYASGGQTPSPEAGSAT